MRRGNGSNGQGPQGSGFGFGGAFSKPESTQETTLMTSFETENATLLGSAGANGSRPQGTGLQNAARGAALIGDSLLGLAWYGVIMPLGSLGGNTLVAWLGTILPLLMLTGVAASFMTPNSHSANQYYLGTRTSFYGFAFLLFANIASYYLFSRSEMFTDTSLPSEIAVMLFAMLGMSMLSIPIWRRFRRHELTESLPMNLMFSDQFNENPADRFKKE